MANWVNSGNWIGLSQARTGVALAQLCYTLNEFQLWSGYGTPADSFANPWKQWETETGQTTAGIPLTKFISVYPGGTEQSFPPLDFWNGIGICNFRPTLEENLSRLHAAAQVLASTQDGVVGAAKIPFGGNPCWADDVADIYKAFDDGGPHGVGLHAADNVYPLPNGAPWFAGFTDEGMKRSLGEGGEFPASPSGALNGMLHYMERFTNTRYLQYWWTGTGYHHAPADEWHYNRRHKAYAYGHEGPSAGVYDIADFEADYDTAQAAAFGAWGESPYPSGTSARDIAFWSRVKWTSPGPGNDWTFDGGRTELKYLNDTAIPSAFRYGDYVAGGGFMYLPSAVLGVSSSNGWAWKAGATLDIDFWGMHTEELKAWIDSAEFPLRIDMGENWPAADDAIVFTSIPANAPFDGMDDTDFDSPTYEMGIDADNAGAGLDRPIDGIEAAGRYPFENWSFVHDVETLKTYA